MSRRIALALVGVVILACYALPYLLLGQVAAWWGSFLFWILAGLAVIVLNIFATRGWEDGE
ncbi:hypothetical protein [Palleronia sp.]|uniref:hypothetical protein n=1 Tax=Palleronia sp. TaxID=1940284 RepID=UPI0035C85F80